MLQLITGKTSVNPNTKQFWLNPSFSCRTRYVYTRSFKWLH